MQMDTVLNLVALAGAVAVAYFGVMAYLRIKYALEYRAWLARLGRQPFHPMQLAPEERITARNGSGQTPGQWFMELSATAARQHGEREPTRLDYVREFRPERLGLRESRVTTSPRR